MRVDILSFLLGLFLMAAPALALDAGIGPPNTGSAVGDGIANDTAALQQVLDRGQTVVLESGKTYRITQTLRIKSAGTGIIGDGTATLLMASNAGAFDNALPQNVYKPNAVGVIAEYLAGPRLESVRIVYEGMVDDRLVKAVAFRKCSAISITGNDISGFSKADGIIYIGAVQGGTISGNTIHDSFTNSTTRGQITGIVADDDDQASYNVMITDNDIHDLAVGDAFRALFGVQTDGINITVRSQNFTVARNRIRNVGEGIDTFGKGGILDSNEITDSREIGIKMVHGASGITVSNNTIVNSGRAGISMAGSQQSIDGDTANNVLIGNTITGVDGKLEFTKTATAGIQIIGSPTFVTTVRNTRIANNVIDVGGTAKFGIFAQKGMGQDNIVQGNTVRGWQKAAYKLDPVNVPGGAQ